MSRPDTAAAAVLHKAVAAIVARDDIVSATKHLSPSAREWVALVVKRLKDESSATVHGVPPAKKTKASAHAKAKAKPKVAALRPQQDARPTVDAEIAHTQTSSAPGGSPGESTAEVGTEENDTNAADIDDDDEEDEHFDAMVKFVFDQAASTPWDERLFKWVMASFDGHASFLDAPLDPSIPPPPLPLDLLVAGKPLKKTESIAPSISDTEYIRSLVFDADGWDDVASFLKALVVEPGGKVAFPLEQTTLFDNALRIVSSKTATYPQPKQSIAAIGLEINSIDSLIAKEKDKLEAKMKKLCDPYLCLHVKTMNILFIFDDEVSDGFLKTEEFTKMKNALSKLPLNSFQAFWASNFPDYPIAGLSQSASVDKKSGLSSAKGKKNNSKSTPNIHDLAVVDACWEDFLQRFTKMSANLTQLPTLSLTTVSNLVSIAKQYQSALLAALEEMVLLCKERKEDSADLVEGTKQNLVQFGEFLNTEFELYRDSCEQSQALLESFKEDVCKEYYADQATSGLGRVERMKTREFQRKLKAFEAEHRKFRMNRISSFQEFVENIQWDGLVLGVEVVGAILDICDADMAKLYEPLHAEWIVATRHGDLFKRRTQAIAQYRDGIRFGVSEYVRAIGRPLSEAIARIAAKEKLSHLQGKKKGKVETSITNSETESAPASQEVSQATSSKKKNKKKKKKASASNAPAGSANDLESEDRDDDDLPSVAKPTESNSAPEDIPIPETVPLSDKAASPECISFQEDKSLVEPSVTEVTSGMSSQLDQPVTNLLPTINSAVAETDAVSFVPPPADPTLNTLAAITGEVQALQLAHSVALQEIHRLKSERNLFVEEINRLNASVVHWKLLAESLSSQIKSNEDIQARNTFEPLSSPPQQNNLYNNLDQMFSSPHMISREQSIVSNFAPPPGLVSVSGSLSNLFNGEGSRLTELLSASSFEMNESHDRLLQERHGGNNSGRKSPLTWRKTLDMSPIGEGDDAGSTILRGLRVGQVQLGRISGARFFVGRGIYVAATVERLATSPTVVQRHAGIAIKWGTWLHSAHSE
ncbi:hypothetical protein HDU84_002379 [Entophlyctis sp. JEL0112]|nr:hypothetical protein HDU84_002379 [Entophlyctis sp. JEL0112]